MLASNPKGNTMSDLINQPTNAPIRKWNFGALGSAIVIAVIAGLTAYDPELGAVWGPVIGAVAGALGFAVPAYLAKNRAP
jgi:hypothetical protein